MQIAHDLIRVHDVKFVLVVDKHEIHRAPISITITREQQKFISQSKIVFCFLKKWLHCDIKVTDVTLRRDGHGLCISAAVLYPGMSREIKLI